MALPKNLTREHILEAIKKIDLEGVPPDAASKFYDVIFNNKSYPPKLIVSYANIFANNKELNRNSFKGGKDTECFKLLEENGFTIVPKLDAFPLITEFILRVHNDPTNLKSLNVGEDFSGFKVETGFGKGNQAKIPWIAFLGEGQAVSKGIYPVYLYYKEQNVLVLAFGISETNPPEKNWKLDVKTVEQYFVSKWHIKPKRYGGSYFFNAYDINSSAKDFGLDKNHLNEDLKELLKIYNSTLGPRNSELQIEPVKKSFDAIPFNYNEFVTDLENSGFHFPEYTIRRFVSSLASKPFVILTGLSGSGKTKLALAFSKWIAKDSNQICIVPVGADWTNREPLLGYPNALNNEDYILPENGALTLIIEANKNPNQPYFLILDEMNLSHVERYFADFLSCMESGSSIKLHPEKVRKNVSGSIRLPLNLFIVGTVNIDETTYMFSPKVLDRASVIEFRIDTNDMREFLAKKEVPNIKELEGKGASMAEDFLNIASQESIKPNLSNDHSKILLELFEVLKSAGSEFGYRTVNEVQRYEQIARKIIDWPPNEMMDSIIMQKLLPKLHGSRRKLEEPLKKIILLCLEEGEEITDYLKFPISSPRPKNVKYRISLEKVQRMYQSLISNSFTSYAEA